MKFILYFMAFVFSCNTFADEELWKCPGLKDKDPNMITKNPMYPGDCTLLNSSEKRESMNFDFVCTGIEKHISFLQEGYNENFHGVKKHFSIKKGYFNGRICSMTHDEIRCGVPKYSFEINRFTGVSTYWVNTSRGEGVEYSGTCEFSAKRKF
jgi:hypothetical protein